MSITRPRIAIVGRFAEHTTANRYGAVINARNLLELVWAAGGEPITLLPVVDSDWSQRLEGISGVLMPGGSDVDPKLYGEDINSEHVYGVDPLQDLVDLQILKHVFEKDLPLLTVCRGTQITNVHLGGTLLQHMDHPHRTDAPTLVHLEQVSLEGHEQELGLSSSTLLASCYHHQQIKHVATGIETLARAKSTNNIEAVRYKNLTWGYGLQWHPEDNYETEPGNLEIVRKFVEQSTVTAR